MKKQNVLLKKLHLSKSKISNLTSEQIVGGSFVCATVICNATDDCKDPTDSCPDPSPTVDCDTFLCVSAVCQTAVCVTFYC
ncbi:hypothetical protein C8N46_10985 [Kordia periserrulae]|uniref:Uncharacterized protein n=1 Tax=Kordia periserrulae TaxID=701523 RepID=A0A2T6BTZ2_9FLAO|nr:hypothetical protein [Kordia periserrulae]PTX59496.1 hypothetical protein C8N46_10985 [Kordia periserrulae]